MSKKAVEATKHKSDQQRPLKLELSDAEYKISIFIVF